MVLCICKINQLINKREVNDMLKRKNKIAFTNGELLTVCDLVLSEQINRMHRKEDEEILYREHLEIIKNKLSKELDKRGL